MDPLRQKNGMRTSCLWSHGLIYTYVRPFSPLDGVSLEMVKDNMIMALLSIKEMGLPDGSGCKKHAWSITGGTGCVQL